MKRAWSRNDIYLSIYLSICRSIDRSICRSIYRSIDRSIYLSIYRSIYVSIIILLLLLKIKRLEWHHARTLQPAGALYIVNKMCVDGHRNVQGWNKLIIMSIVTIERKRNVFISSWSRLMNADADDQRHRKSTVRWRLLARYDGAEPWRHRNVRTHGR